MNLKGDRKLRVFRSKSNRVQPLHFRSSATCWYRSLCVWFQTIWKALTL